MNAPRFLITSSSTDIGGRPVISWMMSLEDAVLVIDGHLLQVLQEK